MYYIYIKHDSCDICTNVNEQMAGQKSLQTDPIMTGRKFDNIPLIKFDFLHFNFSVLRPDLNSGTGQALSKSGNLNSKQTYRQDHSCDQTIKL